MNAKKISSLKLALVVFAVTVSACSEQKYGPPESHKPVEVVTTKSDSQNLSEDEAKVAEILGLPPVSTWRGRALSLQEIDQFSKVIFTPEILNNRILSASPAFFLYLTELQRNLIKFWDLNTGRTELRAAIARIVEAVLKPCATKQNLCSELKVVGQDSSFPQIVRIAFAEGMIERKDRWSTFLMSLEYGLFPQSSSFVQFAFAQLLERAQELKTTDSNYNADAQQLAKITNQVFLASTSQKEATAAFLADIDVWNTEMPASEPKFNLRRAVWSLAVKTQVVAEGKPQPAFKIWIEQNFQKLKQEFDNRPTNLGLDRPSLSSVDQTTLVVLDQLYRALITPQEALAILAQVTVSTGSILSTSEALVQKRFLDLVLKTQEQLGPSLADPNQYVSMRQLQRQLGKARPLENQWKVHQTRIAEMKDLVDTLVKSDSLKPTEFEQFAKIFSRTERNIKWFSIYPNMLPVFYFISKANLSDQFRILWWTIVLNSERLFENLFQGNFGIWFNFTNAIEDNEQLSSPELLLVFRNAIHLGTFANYGLKPSHFIQEAVRRLTMRTHVLLDQGTESLFQTLILPHENGEHRSRYLDAVRFCKGDTSVVEQVELKNLNYYLAPFFAELNARAMEKIDSEADLYSVSMDNRDPTSYYPNGLVEHIRTDDSFYIDVIRNMVAIYESHLISIGETDPAIDEIKKALQTLEFKKKRFLGLMIHSLREFESCYYTQHKLFRDRQIKVMDYEQFYLQQVFNDLQQLSSDPSQFAAMNAKYRRHIPGLDVDSRDRFQKSATGQFGFVYTKADFMIRLRSYLTEGLSLGHVGIATKLPAIAPQMAIRNPVNLLHELNSGYDYQFFFDDNLSTYLELPKETKGRSAFSVFVATALTEAFYNTSGYISTTNARGNNKPFTEWNSQLTDILPSGKVRTLLMAALSKYGPMEVYDFSNKNCQINESYESLEKECVITTELSPQEVLAMQMRMFEAINPGPTYLEMLKNTSSEGYVDTDDLKQNFIVGRETLEVIGLLDQHRWALTQDGLTSIALPQERVDNGHGGGYPTHKGYFTRAQEYYKSVYSNGTPLLSAKAQQRDLVKDLFSGYVEREFAPLEKLDQLLLKADQTKGSTSLVFKTGPLADPLKMPLTTSYSPDLQFFRREFDVRTGYIFKK